MVQSKEFTHLNTQGEVHMVDISGKKLHSKNSPRLWRNSHVGSDSRSDPDPND